MPVVVDPAVGAASVAGSGGELVLHQGGSVSIPAGFSTFISDAETAVTVTGGAADGQLVLVGEGGLDFIAGAGAATVIAGGGNDFYQIGPGAGDQTLLLGDGADTVAAAGCDTIYGNVGGKLVFLGSGTSTYEGHAKQGGAADTVAGGNGAAVLTEVSGSLIAFASGAMTVNGGTSGTTQVYGLGAGARIDVNAYQAGEDPAVTVWGGAGSATVNAGHGILVGGAAGNNVLTANAGADAGFAICNPRVPHQHGQFHCYHAACCLIRRTRARDGRRLHWRQR